MQAQITPVHTNVQTITSAQSLTCVQALLKAGIGCIAYLRNLLPVDNFSEAHLVSESNSQSSGSFSMEGGQGKRNTSGISMMNVNRGFTNEGDRIMDYLELGIFDAIEKQYLRSFIFAIYLDSKDPNNIVEAYTFNFDYQALPGTNIIVPIMSLGDQLSNMSLGTMKRADPVADAMKRGKMPTLGEVKKSLKCRYGNFKLFFNEDTPDSYQPLHFQAGDIEKDRWFFTTHKTGEVPEVTDVGQFKTGWHGVNLKVASVAAYLPSVTEDNNAPFTGIMSHPAPKLTPVEEARLRVEDAELQRKDALDRNVVWSADADADVDAEGEEVEDEGIVLRRIGCDAVMVPIGLRTDDGSIEPMNVDVSDSMEPTIALYGGMSERTPVRVGDLNGTMPRHDLEETQQVPATQDLLMGSLTPVRRPACSLSLPPSDLADSTESALSTQQIDTQLLRDMERMGDGSVGLDAEMLDMETQAPVAPGPIRGADPIGSFDTQHGAAAKIMSKSSSVPTASNTGKSVDEGELDCDCGISVRPLFLSHSASLVKPYCRWRIHLCSAKVVAEDGIIFHNDRDRRLPTKFRCFGCRLHLRRDWDLIASDFADIVSRYKDLAVFRRAIKICDLRRPTTTSQFREQIGCDPALAGQLLTRLETEGFMAVEVADTDEIGVVTKRSQKKGKSKQKKPAKTLQKTKWAFVPSSKRSKAYADYFNPNSEVENHLIGLSSLVRTLESAYIFSHKTRSILVHTDSAPRHDGQCPVTVGFFLASSIQLILLALR
ncbi:hypothetical protein BV22DRAFT_1169347 [Leucogyrophana mollusca]|uniref:Uncharacterized protein n=1 Tax=Leucogyrophana mollusca TaxID=85980 RepID=A0ACB8BF58_9AGAM|nr:hypothetical protein BV22DRAFT_1169347 [Leucogyrophana mollusca]